MPGDDSTQPVLLVACLCAAWCRTCADYRVHFEAVTAPLGARVQTRWVDIEDEADRLGEVDVVDFPTVLLATQGRAVFLGPVLPHAGTLERLVEEALHGRLPPLADAATAAEATALAGRLTG
jgi:thioredoxin-like negative regulator of GroEL